MHKLKKKKDIETFNTPGTTKDKNFIETNLFLIQIFEQNPVHCTWGFYLHLHYKKFKSPRKFLYCILNP